MKISLEKYREIASQKNEIIPLVKEILADTETPVTIYLKLKTRGESFLLESVEHKEETGRYSFVGYQVKKAAVLKDKKLYIENEQVEFKGNPLKVIHSKFLNKKVYRQENYPPFLGGLIGYISYETVQYFDKVEFREKPSFGLPDMAYFWADSLVAVDSQTQKIQVTVLTYPDLSNPDSSYLEGVKKIEEILEVLRSDFKIPEKEFEEPGEIKLTSNIKKEDFLKKVEGCKEYIKSGDIFQLVLSQRFSARTDFSPFQIYRSLRSVNPSPYMYFLDFEDFQIIGASPEVMVKLDLNKKIEMKPIAGTRPRGKSNEEDLIMEKELLSDEKERAEHIMLVDLGRNDIGRIAEPGSVQVTKLMDVERYSHVMHLVSTVTGKVSDDFNWVDALRATFPAGTVSGAPKIRSMQIIDEMEPEKRGPYAGSVMFISADGILNSCITIRTLIYKDGKVYGQAGAGIVYDSQPEKEYQETVNKIRAVFSSIYRLKQDSIL